MMTLADAMALFERKNAEGGIINRNTGAPRVLSRGEISVVFSHVRNAVRAAAQTATPESVRLGPYLEVLPRFAEMDALGHGRHPKREASSVRTFLAVVEGQMYKTRRRVVREAVLPAWLPLFDAVSGLSLDNPNARQPRHRRYPGFIYSFQNFVLAHGIRRPQDLPDWETLYRWAAEGGFRKGELGNCLTAYRTAREELADQSLPPLDRSPAGKSRGVTGLKQLQTVIDRTAGRGGVAADLTRDELVRTLAPRVAEAVGLYVSLAGKSESWNDTVWGAVSCVLAELVRLGFEDDLQKMDILDLYKRKVPIESRGQAVAAISLLSRHIRERSAQTEVSLMRRYMDEATIRSFSQSPLKLVNDQDDGSVPFYTTAIFNDESAIWAVTDFVFGQAAGADEGGLEHRCPDMWAELRGEHDRLRRHMKRINRSRRVIGRKEKRLVTILWPQFVCVALPQLRARVMEYRTRYHEALLEHGPLAPVTRKHRNRFHSKLEPYILTAILLDDGLRIKNYGSGRLNRHFLPRLSHEPDGSRRLLGMETHFRGYDNEAGLKIALEADGSERRRSRSLSPGIVDMDLLLDFLLDLRVQRLVACGELADESDYDLGKDNCALFVSAHSRKKGHRGLTLPRLSKKCGRVLHWAMRDVLGRDLPTWKALQKEHDVRWKYRAIFAAHPMRQVITSYVGGVRERWTLAAYLLNDRISTLQSHYLELEGSIREARRQTGLEHPNHFDAVIDHIWAGGRVDWARFDPENPAVPEETD